MQPEELAPLAHLASPLALSARIFSPFRHRAQQKVMSDALVDAVTGRGPRFIVLSIPPQFGKSQMCSLGAPLWWQELFAHDIVPGGLVGLVSYEDGLAMSWSSKVRRAIEANEQLFATKLRSDSRAAGFWETEQGGGVIAVGIGGAIVGRPISLLVIDDPTKNAEQAASQKHRDGVWDWWQTVAFGRLQPWTVVLVVSTRWSEDDLPGRLLSKDYEGDPAEWRYIRIPAVCDDDETDPLGRELDEPLLRPQAEMTIEESKQEMARVKANVSTYTWNTLWQQHPVDPEGTIFHEKNWRYYGGDSDYTLPDNFDHIVMSWDMAFKDVSSSSFVVGQAWGAHQADRYLLEQVRGRWDFNETCSRVMSFASAIRSRYPLGQAILVEEKANGAAAIVTLRSKVGGIIPINPKDSKIARAWACQPLHVGGNLYAPAPSTAGWVRDYIKELSDFPRSAKDDQVDATTQALVFMMRYERHAAEWYSPSGILIPGVRARVY